MKKEQFYVFLFNQVQFLKHRIEILEEQKTFLNNYRQQMEDHVKVMDKILSEVERLFPKEEFTELQETISESQKEGKEQKGGI